MRCPLCGNLSNSGRCPHSLTDRSKAANELSNVDSDQRRGRIGWDDAVVQTRQIVNRYSR